MSGNPYALPVFTGSNFKPEKGVTKIAHQHARAKRKQESDKVDRQAKLEAIATEKARRIECFKRDHGRCRAFRIKLQLVTDNPLALAHCHHIVFRSHQGSDELFNRVILSPKAHELVHGGRLKIEGADAGKPLTFTLRDAKGVIEKVWEA